MGTPAWAKQLVCAKTSQELLEFATNNQPDTFLILGGGSNLVFCVNQVDSVLKIETLGKKIVQENEAGEVLLEVAAGENWHQLVLWSLEQGLCGLQNLALIPGQVGASPIQNIGAYGVELADVLDSVDVIEIGTGRIKRLDNAACLFGYRNSIFKQEAKGRYVISAVTFKLYRRPKTFQVNYGDVLHLLSQDYKYTKADFENLEQLDTAAILDRAKAISQTISQIRNQKLPDPNVLGNSGSFFKNPIIKTTDYQKLASNYPQMPHYATNTPDYVKIPAGWLIEQAGCKGKRVGEVGTHQNQALVIVNYGNATGQQIFEFSELLIKTVADKFNVILEREVNLIK